MRSVQSIKDSLERAVLQYEGDNDPLQRGSTLYCNVQWLIESLDAEQIKDMEARHASAQLRRFQFLGYAA